jgi:hypothetical protein
LTETTSRRRLLYAAVGLVGASAVFLVFARFTEGERPADEPTPVASPEGISANVGGWIAFQNDYLKRPYGHYSIWAVDPTRPNGPNVRIQLSDRSGKPLAWSSDGSKLLIWREPGALFVLNADGTETRLVTNRSVNVGVIGPIARYIQPGGSFSPTDRRSSLRLAVASTRWMRTVARLASSGAASASATGSSTRCSPPMGRRSPISSFGVYQVTPSG